MTLATVPRHLAMSPKLSDAAESAIRTSPGPGSGNETECTSWASAGSPWRTTLTAVYRRPHDGDCTAARGSAACMQGCLCQWCRGRHRRGVHGDQVLDEGLVAQLRSAVPAAPLQQPGAVGDGPEDEHHHQREALRAKRIGDLARSLDEQREHVV